MPVKLYFSKHNQMLYIESAKFYQDNLHRLPSVVSKSFRITEFQQTFNSSVCLLRVVKAGAAYIRT